MDGQGRGGNLRREPGPLRGPPGEAPSRETPLGKDGEAAEGKVAKKGSTLFGAEDARRGGGRVGRCEALPASNSPLLTLEPVKEQLDAAYRLSLIHI